VLITEPEVVNLCEPRFIRDWVVLGICSMDVGVRLRFGADPDCRTSYTCSPHRPESTSSVVDHTG
jgi:hypothetical protein